MQYSNHIQDCNNKYLPVIVLLELLQTMFKLTSIKYLNTLYRLFVSLPPQLFTLVMCLVFLNQYLNLWGLSPLPAEYMV